MGTFDEHKMACQANGGFLVKIDSASKQSRIMNHIRGECGYSALRKYHHILVFFFLIFSNVMTVTLASLNRVEGTQNVMIKEGLSQISSLNVQLQKTNTYLLDENTE